ncbi:MAG TPA: DUF4468 domain-containing protein [Flavobacteriales bacterium]|nr:DUF4468 domain-containing protein [Flavobacteriales bacterium]
MKTMVVFLLAMLNTGHVQQLENDATLPQGEGGEVEWEGVINAGEVSQDQLMKRARHYFKNDKEYSKAESINGGVKAVKTDNFFLNGDNAVRYKCSYQVAIEVKEGRYKYKISEMVYEQYPKKAQPAPLPIEATTLYREYRNLMAQGKHKSKKAKNSYSICKSTIRLIDELLEEMQTAMATEVAGTDDW